MINKTVTFKLNNLSKRKKKIIETGLNNYSNAIQYLLELAYKDLPNIEKKYQYNGIYTALGVSKWINCKISNDINRFNIQPFKDSIKMDFGILLSGYLNKKKKNINVNYPIAFVSDEDLDRRYNEIMEDIVYDSIQDIYDFEKNIGKLIEKNEKYRPIYFCRTSDNRDFSILYDRENNKYFVKLYLLNAKSDMRKPLQNNRELYYIYGDCEKLINTGRKERFIIVPLSFGKWQEETLIKSRNDPKIIKTAKLYKKKNDYYISINFKIREKINSTITYMGLSRGINTPLCYTIVSKDSTIIYKDKITNRNNIDKTELNNLANQIVGIAYKYKSQLLTVNLSINKGDKLLLNRESNRKISKYDYKQLVKILDNKLQEKNLPKTINVSPIGIYYRCPKCNCFTHRNRISDEIFICTECGNTDNIDDLGSYNVATKINKYKTDKIKIKIKNLENGYLLFNKILGLNLKVGKDENLVQKLESEINTIIYNDKVRINNNYKHKARSSMIRKILFKKKIIDAFEFE